jgi:hypothetical protein
VKKRPTQKDYIRAQLGLEAFRIVRILELNYPDEPIQTGDIGNAYITASGLTTKFNDLVQKCATEIGCGHRCRPGEGVKDPKRILSKFAKTGIIPLDMLAGTLIADSVRSCYEIASCLHAHFEIGGFTDRMIQPKASGYRDLQFQVKIENHIAELKILHHEMAMVDAVEHHVYEVARFLDARASPVEQEFYNGLHELSVRVYNQTWDVILKTERKESS